MAAHGAGHLVVDAHPRVGGERGPPPLPVGDGGGVQAQQALLPQVLFLRGAGALEELGLGPDEPQVPGGELGKGLPLTSAHQGGQLGVAASLIVHGQPSPLFALIIA